LCASPLMRVGASSSSMRSMQTLRGSGVCGVGCCVPHPRRSTFSEDLISCLLRGVSLLRLVWSRGGITQEESSTVLWQSCSCKVSVVLLCNFDILIVSRPGSWSLVGGFYDCRMRFVRTQSRGAHNKVRYRFPRWSVGCEVEVFIRSQYLYRPIPRLYV
jgi:hypothetical protein